MTTANVALSGANTVAHLDAVNTKGTLHSASTCTNLSEAKTVAILQRPLLAAMTRAPNGDEANLGLSHLTAEEEDELSVLTVEEAGGQLDFELNLTALLKPRAGYKPSARLGRIHELICKGSGRNFLLESHPNETLFVQKGDLITAWWDVKDEHAIETLDKPSLTTTKPLDDSEKNRILKQYQIANKLPLFMKNLLEHRIKQIEKEMEDPKMEAKMVLQSKNRLQYLDAALQKHKALCEKAILTHAIHPFDLTKANAAEKDKMLKRASDRVFENINTVPKKGDILPRFWVNKPREDATNFFGAPDYEAREQAAINRSMANDVAEMRLEGDEYHAHSKQVKRLSNELYVMKLVEKTVSPSDSFELENVVQDPLFELEFGGLLEVDRTYILNQLTKETKNLNKICNNSTMSTSELKDKTSKEIFDDFNKKFKEEEKKLNPPPV